MLLVGHLFNMRVVVQVVTQQTILLKVAVVLLEQVQETTLV
jgi:hypothetical protein